MSNPLPTRISAGQVYASVNSCDAVAAAHEDTHKVGVEDVRRLRKARGLSQAELADLVGVTQGLISKIENGDGNPTLETIMRLAVALRVSPAMLFGGLPNRQQRLLDSFEALTPEMQQHAEAILDQLARGRS